MFKTYYLFTLGCQMNVSDSERIKSVLEKNGLTPAAEKSADLMVVNACSVRQKAVDRIWGKLRAWQRVNAKAKKVLTGCVLATDLKKLEEKFDFCFKIDDLARLESYLAPHNVDKKNNFNNYLERKSKRSSKKIAYVPIMSGCNNFCSYCAVPYTRGREWSRRPRAIVKEVRCLVSKGYQEIILLGQNVNSYHSKQLTDNSKQNKNSDFVELLKKLVMISGDFIMKFMSPHPKDFSDRLIDLIACEPKISKEIHLPLQSGDDEILRKMNRGYTTEEYLKIVDKLRSKISAKGGSAPASPAGGSGGKNLRLSTDIIVGFPGEKDKNFKKTVEIIRNVGFSKAYIAMYSPRNGTLAQKNFADSVPQEIKKKRWLILEYLINKSEILNDESNPKS